MKISIKDKIRTILDGDNAGAGRFFNLLIQFLILVSVASFSLETLPDLTEQHRLWLRRLEVFVVSVFSIEYLLRVYAAKARLNYIFSFYGLIDLISVIPFYLALTVDLRSLRLFRLLRLFRIFKLVRYSEAMRRFVRAFVIAREEVILFGIVAIMLLYLSAVGIYYFENEAQPENFKSVFHSMWWSVATLTTVGYGDIYPITAGGRIFTFVVLMIGLGVVAVPAGVFASALSRADQEEK